MRVKYVVFKITKIKYVFFLYKDYFQTPSKLKRQFKVLIEKIQSVIT